MAVATDPRKTRIASAATLLAESAIAVALTGSTSETTLATVAIPAGAMGLNGGVRVVTRWSMPSSANTKTPRIRHGGVGGTVVALTAYTTNTFATLETSVMNRGSAASQYYSAFGNRASDVVMCVATPGTSAKDSAVAQDVVISGQLALGSETLTLESYEVWLVP